MYEFLVFILLVIVIVFLVKANENAKKIKALEINLFKLQQILFALQQKEKPKEPVQPEEIIEDEKPVQAASPITKETARPIFSGFTQKKTVSTARTKAEWESLIGGKILNRIGALALIIGIGFFLKYAFDNNWITESMRVVIGFLSGSLLLFLGNRFHKKEFQIFAQGLSGAGIAVLYLSAYASFNFYNLVPQWIAFLMMSVVTIITFIHAVKFNSVAVSLIGWAGGFITPFLLSTGIPNPSGLFIYLIILNLGLLLILLAKKEWYIIEPLSLIATYVIYFAWFDEYFVIGDFYTAMYALPGFWLLFFISGYLQNQAGPWSAVKKLIPILNIVLFYSAVYSLIESSYPEYDSLATFIISWVYFVAAYSSREKNLEYFFRQNLVIGFILLFAATELQFSGFVGVILWGVETAALYFLLKKLNEEKLDILLFAVALAVAINLIFTEKVLVFYPAGKFVPIISLRTAAYLISAGIIGLVSFFPLRIHRSSEKIAEIFKYIFCLILFTWVTVEINDYFRSLFGGSVSSDKYITFLRILFLSLGWMIFASALIFAGRKISQKPLIFSASAVIGLAVLFSLRGLEFYPLSYLTIFANLRVLILLLISGMLLFSYWMAKDIEDSKFMRIFLAGLRISIVLVLLILITGEIRDYFMKEMLHVKQSAELSVLENLKQLSLSGAWLVYSILLMIIGLWKRMQGLRVISIILFGFTILKIFIYDLSFLETLYRIFSFIGLGLILLIVSYLYQKYKEIIFK